MNQEEKPERKFGEFIEERPLSVEEHEKVPDIVGLVLSQYLYAEKKTAKMECIATFALVYEKATRYATRWKLTCLSCDKEQVFNRWYGDGFEISITRDLHLLCKDCYAKTPDGIAAAKRSQKRREAREKLMKKEGVSSKSTTVNKKKSVAGIKKKSKNQRNAK